MTTRTADARINGSTTTNTIAIVCCLGLAGLVVMPRLGSSFEQLVVDHVDADRVNASKPPSEAGRQHAPTVGSRAQAAVNIGRLFRMIERLPEAARAGIDGYAFDRALSSAVKHQDATAIGRALVPEALRHVDASPSVGQAPLPNQYAAAMQLMSHSKRNSQIPLPELRQVYDHALTSTLPHVLQTMQDQYLEAFRYTRGDHHEWLRWHALAKRKVKELANRGALSADDVFDLVDAIESAKYGKEVEVRYRRFTPIFSETLVSARSEAFVDAMIAARKLHREGHEILFPYEIAPPHGAEYTPSKLISTDAAPTVHLGGASRSQYVTELFDNASRPRFTPERARRRALVNETFPGSELYSTRPEDARAIIASTYLNAASRRQQNKFGEWWVKVRQHVKTNLSDEQRAMVQKITSLPRIIFGANKP